MKNEITAYSKELLEKWKNEEVTGSKITDLLTKYARNYDTAISNKTQRTHFENYLRGLMSDLDRKSVEPIALSITGKKGVRALQQFLNRSTLSDEAVLNEHRRLLGAAAGSKNGMLSVDGSEFRKKGHRSAGVGKQYSVRAGKAENCQAGLFSAYAGDNGHGIIDRDIYLPKSWFAPDYDELRKKCDIPEEMSFQKRSDLALSMVRKALDSNKFHIKWIGCGADFGSDHGFVDALPESVYFFAGANPDELVFLADTERNAPVSIEVVASDESIPWQRTLLTKSIKGSVYADFKCLRCISSRQAEQFGDRIRPHKEIWLYIRRYENDETKYFLSNAPDTMAVSELHDAEALRWRTEQCLDDCKKYLGMGHFEGRSYTGFLRHLLFVMIAHFFVTSLRIDIKMAA